MDKRVTIYTDGSCRANGKANSRGGWAAILLYGEHRKELSGGEAGTTSCRMELSGAIAGLEALKEPCEVSIYTDSEYLRGGITSWIHGWKRNGWKTAAGKDVKNRDLWERLDKASSKHKVQWNWVRGHAQNELNNAVDVLAQAASGRVQL
jgi:ribonuclease HI